MRGQRKNKKLLVLFLIIAVLIFAGKLFLDAIYVPVIIMYHSVGTQQSTLDGYGPKLNVLPKTFAKQMRFLARHNYNVISLTEFIEMVKSGKKIPHKTIAITFDDGLKNNFLNAYPVLKKYNLPATIFIPTDFIGKEKFLNPSDIEIMQEDNISIGSHTLSHRWLPSLNEKEIREELFASKEILEEMTGREIKVLSYPLGGFNKKVEKIAEEVGYIGAVATNPGKKAPKDDIFALKRIRISMTSDNLLIFWIETSGYYTVIKETRDED